MEIRKIKISELKPNPNNPRKSNITQDENLKKSLEKFGVVEPVVFNKQSGYIVGGHFRVRELKKLGYKEVECVIVDLNEQDEKELLIRLNANTGDWDTDLLLQDWDADKLADWGVDMPKFETGDIVELDKIVTTYNINIKCETPEECEEMKQKLGITANSISASMIIGLLA